MTGIVALYIFMLAAFTGYEVWTTESSAFWTGTML